MRNSPFDGARDPALGAELAQALTPADSASFTSRVLARLGARTNSWDVLASWARPGVAAGLLLATLLGYWIVTRSSGGAAPRASELLAAEQRFDGGMVMDVVLGSKH
jgi:hypothetical protein